MNEKPLEFKDPELPRYINPKKQNHRIKKQWPHKPGPVTAALGTVSKAGGKTISDFHLVSGSEFVMALCGESHGLSHDFYLQRLGNALLVQKAPNDKVADIANGGFFLEDLCHKGKKSPTKTYFSVCKLHVGISL